MDDYYKQKDKARTNIDKKKVLANERGLHIKLGDNGFLDASHLRRTSSINQIFCGETTYRVRFKSL